MINVQYKWIYCGGYIRCEYAWKKKAYLWHDYFNYIHSVALWPWKSERPALFSDLYTAVRDRWLQVVVARDRELSFSVFWDLTGMNWPRLYGRFCCQMLARVPQQFIYYSKSQLVEEREEKTFSCYMSSGFRDCGQQCSVGQASNGRRERNANDTIIILLKLH